MDFLSNSTKLLDPEDSEQQYKHFRSFSSSFIFKQSISRIWEIMKDIQKSSTIFEDFEPKIEFIKGNDSFTEGNEFRVLWKGLFKLNVKVNKVVDKNLHKELMYTLQGIDHFSSFIYIIHYILKFSTSDKSTILIWNMRLDEKVFSKDQIDDFKRDREVMCVKLDNYLKSTADSLYSIESIIIKKNRSILWKIITDWEVFRQQVPCIAEKVEYQGEKMAVGSIIILKWESKNIECKLKIIKIDKKEEDNDWVFALDCFEGSPKLPQQELYFTVSKISDNATFVHFKHQFKQPLKYEYFEPLTKHKKNILKSLKNVFKKEKK